MFIESNPGFKSRFDKTFKFEDYKPEELWFITKNLLQKESLTPTSEAETHLKNYLIGLYENRDSFFGNARSARQVVGEVVMKQNLRLASMPSEKRRKEDLIQLIFDDVKHLQVQSSGTRPTLGFQFGQ